jgi:hypothetical protein
LADDLRGKSGTLEADRPQPTHGGHRGNVRTSLAVSIFDRLLFIGTSPATSRFSLRRRTDMTDQKKKGDFNQWEKEGVGGNRKQDNSDEASRSNTDTATQNSGTGKRR